MGNNNKTPEQIKKEQFEANPDNFIHRKDLIVSVERKEKGFAYQIGQATRNELHIVRSTLDIAFLDTFKEIRSHKAGSGIVAPAGRAGLRNFLRRK